MGDMTGFVFRDRGAICVWYLPASVGAVPK